MIAVVSVLLALPLGYLVCSRLVIGAGAVCLGHWLRSRRRAGTEVVAGAR